MIVVDTSVLVDFLRGGLTPATKALHELEARDTPFAIPLICCQEVLQGARDDREWKLLDEFLSTQRTLPPTDGWETHQGAARIFFDCRRRGVTVRSSVDCLIAQQILEVDGVLLHNDVDFDRIAEVRPLRVVDLK